MSRASDELIAIYKLISIGHDPYDLLRQLHNIKHRGIILRKWWGNSLPPAEIIIWLNEQAKRRRTSTYSLEGLVKHLNPSTANIDKMIKLLTNICKSNGVFENERKCN